MFSTSLLFLLSAIQGLSLCHGLAAPTASRRTALGWIAGAATGGWLSGGNPQAWADAGAGAGGIVEIDEFLRTGMVAQPMGISGQAGKSKPETGVVLR